MVAERNGKLKPAGALDDARIRRRPVRNRQRLAPSVPWLWATPFEKIEHFGFRHQVAQNARFCRSAVCVSTVSIVMPIKELVPVRAEDVLDPPHVHHCCR